MARDLTSILLALCAVLIGAKPLLGQPGSRMVESVETMVANSTVIVVGRVSRIDFRSDSRLTGFSTELTVEETLKGTAAQRVIVQFPVIGQTISRWRDTGARLLVAIHRDALAAAIVIDLEDPGLAVLTADFVVLRDSPVVIRAVREAIGRVSAGADDPTGFFFTVPPDLIAGTTLATGGYSGLRVNVPIDARLERRALAILRGEQGGSRSEAVNALRYFRSDANASLLTTLLADTTLGTQRTAQDNMGHEILVYYVRQAAYEVLTAWGLAPPQPVLRVDTYRPDLATTVDLSNKPVTVTDLRELRPFVNLRVLVLRNTQLPAGGFQEISALGSLRELVLGGSNVTDEDLGLLTSLAKLEALGLVATGVTDAGLRTIADFSALKTVDVARTRVTASGLAALRLRRPDLMIDR